MVDFKDFFFLGGGGVDSIEIVEAIWNSLFYIYVDCIFAGNLRK
jgi:hypothetical protein